MTEQYIEELIRKYAEGTANEDEVQILMSWYRRSTPDEVKWPSLGVMEKDNVSRRMLDRLTKEISPRKTRLINMQWLRVAATLLIAIGLVALFYFLRPSARSYITLTNPSGKIQLISLPDDSKVWLNASTTIQYLKSFKNDRKVKLKGEAYFEVAHDPKHRFSIQGGGVTTTVLGTSFNVKAYPSQKLTTVSVITGKVRVDEASKELAILSPSTQIQYDRINKISKTISIDTNLVLAWRKGRLQFQGETFAEIADVLENWYGIQIIFANPQMQSCRYYMSFDNSLSIEKILSTISEITEMQYVFDRSNNIVTLSGKGCG